MNNDSKAKRLITGEQQPINEGPGDIPPGAPGEGMPPRRPMRGSRVPNPLGWGGPAGGPGERERSALKDLVILDLLHALNNDRFYTEIANVALGNGELTPAIVRHFLDEAGKYADKMSPEVNELMGKISQMPTQ